jgi:hypothetical protein
MPILGSFMILIGAQEMAAAECISPDNLHVDTIDKPFTQERYLTGMSAPLKSEGDLKVTKDQISWHMTKPFNVETLITPQGITQSVDGGPAQPVGPGASDLSTSIARLFANLLQGKWGELETFFHVSKGAAAPGTPWSISLKAIDPQMQKVFGTIDVEGCKDISTIRVDHENGDHEVIHFDAGDSSVP